MTEKTDICQAWGGCPLPQGHNMGKPDLPENHHSQSPCSDPACGHLDGALCDFHSAEIGHASRAHTFCGVDCEGAFPSDTLRNTVLYRAIPGADKMLAELERRAGAAWQRRIAELESLLRDADQMRRDWVAERERADAAESRVRKLEAELRIGPPWVCHVCGKENNRDVCVICETYRPE
jgi:hypothetical protein